MDINIIRMPYKEPLSLYPMKITFYLMMGNDHLLNPKYSLSPAAMNFIDKRPGEAPNRLLPNKYTV